MKVIPLEEAKVQLGAIFDEVRSGAAIRLKAPNGREVELTPVSGLSTPLSATELADAYADSDWAHFENNCGKASD